MGNQLEKQYGLKQNPIKLPGSYNFLKYADHPSDKSSSLIIIRSPHKAGIIPSDIILPIKNINNVNNDYSVAITARCKPIGLVKPRSEAQLKLIMSQLIKLTAQIGRVFLCEGKLMLWCEQVMNPWHRSPEQVETGKSGQKSKVFWAGLSLCNFLNFLYEKQSLKKKKDKAKQQIQSIFSPKDKKQYIDLINNIEYRLTKTTFWESVSQGMKNLIIFMLSKDPSHRIEMNTLKQLAYFTQDRQLKLYSILVDQFLKYDQKQTIIFMETLQLVIKDRIIFDDLILDEYLIPFLLSLLFKKPEAILSCLIQLPDPPRKSIFNCIKKGNPQNYKLFTVVINKKEKIYNFLDQDEYDAAMARTAFCSFESEILLGKILNVIPYLLQTIKESNYKKQIEFQLITNVLENDAINKKTLLLALKCTISLLNKKILSNFTKLFNLKYDSRNFEDLQINLHILELYRLMILQIQPQQLFAVMMPKLNFYLSNLDLTDQIFFMAKRCVDLIMKRLYEARELNIEDEAQIQYEKDFFEPVPIAKPSQEQIIEVLNKEANKSKDPNIQWLSTILVKQKFLTQL